MLSSSPSSRLFSHHSGEASLPAPAASCEINNKSGGEAVIDQEQANEDFLVFFEDLYVELSKFGRVEGLHVVENLGDHLIGHVYCKFSDEEEASDALQVMNGRYYDGRRMEVEYSPVTDFREARCRDYDEDACARGGFCNFLHVKPVPMCLIRSMEEDCEADRIRDQEERRAKEREEKRARKESKKRKRERKERKSSHRSSRSRKRSSSRDRGGAESDDDDRSYSQSP
ncbi:U2AF 26 kDa subunit [Seminavis robusta]|uniref:U2AF 26 kDa subunit n=1 Tax=Seminavis robusta TaxID=568900 RepID=A0A9N8DV94_9STRA|nr:U2AF 26 kDa subunit [Seminavis robusta]|eukprot:Sro271_g104570.1 U2AF 26 kDa subunit (228) ;mRNA; f:45706-46902